jgi:hypothetical protein
VLVVVVLAAAAACTSGTDRRSASPAPPSTAAHHAGTHGTGGAVKATPRQLRAQFEQLYGLHALLAVRLMRAVASSSRDFAQAAAATLGRNTDAVSRQVAAAYGATEADRFRRLWQRRNDTLVAYANGVAGDDPSAREQAREDLIAGSGEHGAWIAGASKGRVQASAATRAMRAHVEHLTRQLDAFAARDYDQAYRLERAAYEHMFATGATLAKGSVTPQVAAGLDAPPEKLRSAFGMLLGAHMELVVGAQRAAFAGAPEFDAAAAQVNANTTAISRAMGAIGGPLAGGQFQQAWAGHVEGLIDYSTAVAARDEAAKARAERDMHTSAVGLAVYFSRLAPKDLDFVTLTRAVTAHDAHLVDQIDAYAARDYLRAHQMESAGYQQMRGVSDVLVGAIQRKVQAAMPVGGSQTGGGATALGRR